ncbi:hypothetical protein GCM10023084_49030 [Streptomyces lacrimifluminis]|uniref:Uncharacterized protein n=1 Tax=Streptomyces lacrimifluminis TaxID=1500077 RepID=A0A917P140_9ACTN|nr:hypothetical protein GCM10012282_52430 [Streptomyces lacrimifluminis]
MPQDDLPAYGDLVGAESERHGLDGERLVDPGGEVEGADDHVVGAGVTVVLTGEARHVGRLQGVRSVLAGRGPDVAEPPSPERSGNEGRFRTGRS